MLFTPLKPMLLHKSDLPPAGEYIHQLKYDGFRCHLHVEVGKVKLFTRHQNDCTAQFQEFAGVNLPPGTILDGEMITFGDDGKPDFEAVMSRFQTRRRGPKQPVTLPRLTPSMPVAKVMTGTLLKIAWKGSRSLL